MVADIDSTTSPEELDRKVAVFPVLRKRRKHQSNIWFFESPKIRRRFAITDDVAFMYFILLEGDQSVTAYEPSPAPVFVNIKGEMQKIKLDAHIHFKDKHVEWWEFKSEQETNSLPLSKKHPKISEKAQAALEVGIPYQLKTAVGLRGKEILFDNWLNLCACINRCRNQSISLEISLILNRIEIQPHLNFSSLLEIPGIDIAFMHAAVALSLQRGVLETELENTLFGLSSILTKPRRSVQ